MAFIAHFEGTCYWREAARQGWLAGRTLVRLIVEFGRRLAAASHRSLAGRAGPALGATREVRAVLRGLVHFGRHRDSRPSTGSGRGLRGNDDGRLRCEREN